MILTYLDLSTGHLKEDTMQLLQRVFQYNATGAHDMGWPAVTVAPYECGVFITVPAPEHITGEQMDALPSDLEKVLSYARDQGATLVHFDAYGESTPNLPIYDW